MEKREPGEKFSNHPCHRLSVPSAKRFWCRHCFEMFDDPISRWRHSKGCKNTTLSNSIRRREQEATALEAYCESTNQSPDTGKPVTLPNLNPKSTTRSYAGPKEDSIVDLSCFICKRQFTSIEEMKEHVRVPCNKVSGGEGDHPVYHRHRGVIFKGDGEEVEEMVYHGQEARQSPTPIDTSHLSSETMAAVEALNMMARSDNVNLTQFLNQLSEGGFVIEQAAGTSSGSGSQDREIIFTVQGDGSEPGSLLQHGADITVEVAEDLIRMAQRVRVEAVEHVVEEQVVQEEVVQDLEPDTEVRYIDDQSELVPGSGAYPQVETEYAEEEEQAQFDEEQTQEEVKEEGQDDRDEVVQEEAEVEAESTFTIVNLVSGKTYSGNVVVSTDDGTEKMDSETSESVEVGNVPIGDKPVVKDETSIPVEKRKLEEDVVEEEGQARVKVEGASQVKKLCTEMVTDHNVCESSVKDEVFEAKKKLQFFSEGLIVQEKCNKKSESPQKSTLETVSAQMCNNVEILPSVSSVLLEDEKSHPTNVDTGLNFLDEVDGEFKPMTEDMVKVQESIVDISALTKIECESVDEIFTVIKKEPRHKPFLPSPKALRSSSRKLVLTPKKLRLLEEKEKRNTKKNKCRKTGANTKSIQSNLNRKSVKTPPSRNDSMDPKSLKSDFNNEATSKDIKTELEEKIVKEEKVDMPVEKPKKMQTRLWKCRACDKVFNTQNKLIKHKSVPCVLKVTRNMCQNILRPKRALPRLPEKKVIRKKSVSKEIRKPKLMPVGLHIHAQWIACKQERKLTRGRGRPRKQTVHYERRKHIVLPDRTLEVSSLSEKEKFFFELALVCSDYVLAQPNAEISKLLKVGVDNDCDKLSASDMSPPILEKIDPHVINNFVSEHPPDLICSENLEPPTLKQIGSRDAAKIDTKDVSNNSCGSPILLGLDSDSKQDRHFLDSFTHESDKSISPCKTQVTMNVDENVGVKTVQSPDVDLSPKKNDLMAHLKSTLKDVRSPSKCLSNSRKTRPDIASNVSPNPKRNLFDALQTLCSDSRKTGCPNTTPTLSASVLCSKLKANISRNLSPRKHVFSPSPRKPSSAHSTPRKMPNILLRRSASETKERSSCILGVVAQSMGINVLNLSPTSNNKDSKSERSVVSPLRDSHKETALTCLGKLATPVQIVRMNLFAKNEPAVSANNQSKIVHNEDNRTHGPVQSKTEVSIESESGFNPMKPMIAMSNLQSGQILVSPIPAGSNKCPVKYASLETSRSDVSTQCRQPPVKTVLGQLEPMIAMSNLQSGQILVSPIPAGSNKCPVKYASLETSRSDVSTQCRQPPVKTVLRQLEQKLKLLKSSLQSQPGSNPGSPSKLTDKELVSILLKESNEHHAHLRQISMNKCGDKESSVNLPDVVRSVTESRNCSGNLPEIAVNPTDSTVVDRVETVVNICKETASDFREHELSIVRDSYENNPSQQRDLTESIRSENHSDFNKSSSDIIDGGSDEVKVQHLDQSDSTRPSSDSNDSSSVSIVEDSNRVKVQYINQLDSMGHNGLTYLLIQQEGSNDYLTSCLGADFTLEAGETIHAVTIEEDEEVLTDSLIGNMYTSGLSRTEREVYVHSSGF